MDSIPKSCRDCKYHSGSGCASPLADCPFGSCKQAGCSICAAKQAMRQANPFWFVKPRQSRMAVA